MRSVNPPSPAAKGRRRRWWCRSPGLSVPTAARGRTAPGVSISSSAAPGLPSFFWPGWPVQVGQRPEVRPLPHARGAGLCWPTWKRPWGQRKPPRAPSAQPREPLPIRGTASSAEKSSICVSHQVSEVACAVSEHYTSSLTPGLSRRELMQPGALPRLGDLCCVWTDVCALPCVRARCLGCGEDDPPALPGRQQGTQHVVKPSRDGPAPGIQP